MGLVGIIKPPSIFDFLRKEISKFVELFEHDGNICRFICSLDNYLNRWVTHWYLFGFHEAQS
jgi:hypothetical protein